MQSKLIDATSCCVVCCYPSAVLAIVRGHYFACDPFILEGLVFETGAKLGEFTCNFSDERDITTYF